MSFIEVSYVRQTHEKEKDVDMENMVREICEGVER